MPLINCEINVILTWSENYILIDKTTKAAQDDNLAINTSKTTTFQITDTKLYAPVVTLSNQDDKKLLEQLKTRLQRPNKWNKYRSEMSNQTKNNNFSYLIDPKFIKVNRRFDLSFENEDDYENLFSKYDKPTVQIKDVNVLIDGKMFFDTPIKSKEEAYKTLIK